MTSHLYNRVYNIMDMAKWSKCGIRLKLCFSNQRGYGIRVMGKGVMDHFIAELPQHNTDETVETVFRIIGAVERAIHKKTKGF